MILDNSVKERAWEYINTRREDILRELAELVAIPSVGREDSSGYPYGRECARALDYVLELSKRKGLEVYNGGYRYGLASWGKGSRHVGIFSHVDVVEAGEGWIYPPFQCTEDKGWLIGRGVGDDKHAALLGIYALCAIRDLGLANNCRFTVYFGCCEERGMGDLDAYLREQKQPDICLVPDIRFPVCIGERGNMKFTLGRKLADNYAADISGGLASNIVPPSACARLYLNAAAADRVIACAGGREKTVITCDDKGGFIEITAHGRQTSSSMAFNGVNAIGVLFDFLAKARGLPDIKEGLLEECAKICTQWDGGVFGISCGDDTLGPLTCPCVGVHTEAGMLNLEFNLRYPAICQGSELFKKIASYASANGWELTEQSDSPPYSLDPDSVIVKLLYDTWAQTTGKNGKLFGIGGGTYARKLKNAVGFGPHDGEQCPFLPEGHGSIHGPDEARSLDNLLQSIQIYISALWAIDRYYFKEMEDNK